MFWNKLQRNAALVLLVALLTGTSLASRAEAAPDPLYTNARASALIDVKSGRILYSSNGDVSMRIASLTKIMTAIVAIEHGHLTDMVKTGKRAVGKEGSSIYLRLGEEMSLLNMLYGLMLRSGNDAATAIAEHVGGSEEGFVHLMNEKASFLGLAHTQFKNPHGLDDEGHYSSANDLARLTAYSLKNEVFAEIVKTRVKKVPNPHEKWDYSYTNKNKMLAMYEGADGVKTGYTKKALRCLVSSATRNGQQLAAVTINDRDDWADHRKMLDWGFAHYPLKQVAAKGQAIAGYPYVVGREFNYPLESQEEGAVQSKLVLYDAATMRYAFGERGLLEWYMNGHRIGAVPVYDTGSSRLSLPETTPKSLSSWAEFEKASKQEADLADSIGKALGALFGT
ncbi:D-alanyl-D-alanine carboxypeptidase family protein [Paenibacillus arenilitoris]|uniref:D-alanyl-D-alanine carboxypeptidase n=1 Tax=Paenibacillus arenilitoris TaxID=2772299 RepID=A0A927CLH3_9BACL|nr:D-alanyl-D-alanine carboxypeptidase family protein [Paenibacillus arenilitoris]MBD2869610.1 D-alanyl-D-alanine carboxypeptidase [Paenibacillus arenilitoris]